MNSVFCRISLLLLMVATISSCSLWRYKTAQPPQVTVTSLQLAGFSIFEQKFDVGLRLKNPNDFALPITGMQYKLAIEDNAVAAGETDANITVPALGEQTLTVSVTGDFLSSLSQLQRWQQNPGSSLKYRLQGSLKMADVTVRIPFDYSGNFELNQN